jgi:hypothetical protein
MTKTAAMMMMIVVRALKGEYAKRVCELHA